MCIRDSKKTSPANLVKHCVAADADKKLMENLPKLLKKRFKGKAKVMSKALTYLASKHPDGYSIWKELGYYRGQSGDKAQAVEAYRKALSLTDDPTQLLLVAEAAKKLGGADVYMACVKKACEKGMTAACGLVSP